MTHGTAATDNGPQSYEIISSSDKTENHRTDYISNDVVREVLRGFDVLKPP